MTDAGLILAAWAVAMLAYSIGGIPLLLLGTILFVGAYHVRKP